MIVVTGKLEIREGKREEFLSRSIDSINQARRTAGCVDFSVSADPVEANRVNIFEEWNSQENLDAFRDSGPSHDLFDLVKGFDVKERRVE